MNIDPDVGKNLTQTKICLGTSLKSIPILVEMTASVRCKKIINPIIILVFEMINIAGNLHQGNGWN